MFGTRRRLKAIFLLVAVMSASFVLFDTFFVQETTAQSGTTQCDIWDAQCGASTGFAYAICSATGWQSTECHTALLQAFIACQPYFQNCGGG